MGMQYMSLFINSVYESSDIAILKMKNVDYYSIVSGVSKLEAKKLSQNIDLTEKNKLFKIY